MTELLNSLTAALEGTAWLALAAALVWGVLSILLSPCHLASIPLVIGFIDDQGARTTRHAFLLALLFATGILITIALIGVVTAALGRIMGDLGPWPTYLVAGILVFFGLHLADVIPLSFGRPQANVQRKGLLAAFLLGFLFGVALGPCTFAFMAPLLAVAFKAASAHALYGAMLLVAYGVGHCGVIVAAGTSTELVQRFLGWTEASRGTGLVKRLCGVLVVLAGFYLAWRA